MHRLSLSLPKYDIAIHELYQEFYDYLHMQDDILRMFPPIQVIHSGTIRFLSTPNILEESYKPHKSSSSADLKVITNTDSAKFKDFLFSLITPLMEQSRKLTDDIINNTCDTTGNSIDAKDRNIWDAYIDALQRVEMVFDDDGNPNFIIYPLKFYEKLSGTQPTDAQLLKAEQIFEIKKRDYYTKKNSRRLGKREF